MNIRVERRIIIVAATLILTFFVNSAHLSAQTPPSPSPQQPHSLRPVETLPVDALVEKYGLPTKTPGEKMTLEQAIKAADERNLSLAAMKAEIAVAQGRLKTAWGGVLPIIQGKMGYKLYDHEDTFAMGPQELVVNPQHDVDGQIEASLSIVDAKAWFAIRVAKEARALAHMNVETVRQQIFLNVAEAFFSCLMAEKLIDIHMATLAAFDYQRNIAESRFKAGGGLRIDVVRAETDLEIAKQQLISANLFFDNARDALAVLTDTEGLPMPVDPKPVPVPERDIASLQKEALETRRDIKAARAAADVQRTQVNESYMRFVPVISSAWSGSYQFTDPGDLGSDDRSRMVAIFSLTVPIYDHFRYGELHSRRALVKKSELEIDGAELRITMEVRKARRDYMAALASVETARKQADLSKEALGLTEAAYNAGTGNSLDVTDARRTALQSDVNYATRRLEAQTALLRLIYSIGEDLSLLGKE